jgi:hypothetical protein
MRFLRRKLKPQRQPVARQSIYETNMNWHATTFRLIAAAKCVVPAALFVPSLLILSSEAQERHKTSLVAPATAVADGRPWSMVVIDGKKAFKLTLMPNGTGTVKPSSGTPELTWWQSGERVCLKSSLNGEHCVILLAREGGYDAVENSALFFTLRR